MNRRDFLVQAAGAAAVAAPLSGLQAQGGFVEGRHYVRLGTPQPVLAPSGKVEVVEFFGYFCPHCNAFEPALEAWVNTLPPDVMFRRMPVAFLPRQEALQRLYFALEAMGQVANLHRRVFAAIHVERLPLEKPETIADFVAKNGVDRAKFLEVFDSFSVQSKARQARQLAEGYKIDGVPALGIHGRFYTSPSLVGGDGAPVAQAHTMALRLADQLIAQVRKR
jgi:thiol:disulfide interchange protein DsbA